MGFLARKGLRRAVASEKDLGITRKYSLAGGKSYVVEESPPDISFDAFVNILATSHRDQPAKVVGLAISRQHPDLIRQKYGLEETPIYWLATRTGQDVISPTNLGNLTHPMRQIIQEDAR